MKSWVHRHVTWGGVVYLLVIAAVTIGTVAYLRDYTIEHTNGIRDGLIASCERANVIRAEVNRRAEVIDPLLKQEERELRTFLFSGHGSLAARQQALGTLVRLTSMDGFETVKLVDCKAVVAASYNP